MLKKIKKIFIAGLLILATTNLSALPVSVQKDMYMSELSKYLKAKDYDNASDIFKKMDTLIVDYNVEVPASYYYFKGETLVAKNRYEKAKKALDTYLNATGTKGRYYKDALSLYVKVEKQIENKKALLQKESNGYYKIHLYPYGFVSRETNCDNLDSKYLISHPHYDENLGFNITCDVIHNIFFRVRFYKNHPLLKTISKDLYIGMPRNELNNILNETFIAKYKSFERDTVIKYDFNRIYIFFHLKNNRLKDIEIEDERF